MSKKATKKSARQRFREATGQSEVTEKDTAEEQRPTFDNRTGPASKRTSPIVRLSIGDGPIVNIEQMTEREFSLFTAVATTALTALNASHGLTRVNDLEQFFSMSIKSSLFIAGIYVRNLRNLTDELQEGEDSS